MWRWGAAAMFLVVGCRGAAGQNGGSCHVEKGEGAAAVVRCDDGTGTVITSGSDGKSCTVDSLAPGEWRLSCPDGTSVVLHDGEGCTLKSGEDGVQRLSCPDGSEVVVGAPGPRCTYANSPKVLSDGFPTADAVSGVSGLVTGPGGQLFAMVTVTQGTTLHGQLLRSRDDGGTWQVVDEFLPTGATGALGNAVAVSPEGLVFAGFVEVPTGRWYLRRSADDGASFTTVDSAVTGWTLRDVATGPDGLVLMSGRNGDSFVVRASHDYGETWRTADQFDPDGRAWGEASAVRVTKNGIFAAGVVQIGQMQHWIVRRSRDGGHSFQTVDDFAPVSPGAYAVTMAELPDGTLAVAGDARMEDGSLRAHVRRSADGGRTWTTVDAAGLGKVNGIGVDPLGRLLVLGTDGASAAQTQATIRASTDGGRTFSTLFSASYSLPTGFVGHENALALDSQGGLWLPASATVSPTEARAILFHWDCR